MVVGWMFSGVGCHATSRGAELSYDLDYSILFWSWILSAFCGNIHVLWILSAFCGFTSHLFWLWILSIFRGNIHVLLILSAFLEISTFRGYYPNFVDIRPIFHIYPFSESDWCTLGLVPNGRPGRKR